MADYQQEVAIIKLKVDDKDPKKQIAELSKSIVDQKEKVKKNNAQIKLWSKGTKGQKEKAKQLQIENLKLTDGIKSLNQQRTQAVKISKVNANSLDALRLKSAKLKKEMNNLDLTQKGNVKRFKEISKELKNVNETIRTADGEAGDFKTNIGNYPAVLGAMQGGLAGVRAGLRGFITGMKGAIRSSLTFLATPIGAVIGALGVVLAPIIIYLTTVQEGMDKLNRVIKPLTSVIEALFGWVQQLGKALVTLDFSNMAAASEKVANSARLGYQIALLEESIRRKTIILTKEGGKIELEMQELKGKAEQRSKFSAEERLKFIKEAQKRQEAHAKLVTKLAKDELAKIAIEDSLNDTSDEKRLENAQKVNEINRRLAGIQKKKNGLITKEESIQNEITAERKKQEKLADDELKRLSELNKKRLKYFDLRLEKSQLINRFIREDEIANSKEIEKTQNLRLENETILFQEGQKKLAKIRQRVNADERISLEDKKIAIAENYLELENLNRDHEKTLTAITSEFQTAQKNIEDQTRKKAHATQHQIAIKSKELLEEKLARSHEQKVAFAQREIDTLKATEGVKEEALLQAYERLREIRQAERARINEEKLAEIDKEEEALTTKLANDEITEEEAQLRRLELRQIKEQEIYDHKQTIENIELGHAKKVEKITGESYTNLEKKRKVFQSAQQVGVNLLQGGITKSYDKRIKAVDKRLADGLISEKEAEREKIKIEKDKAKRLHQIQVAQFLVEKATAIKDVIISTKTAIAKAIATVPLPASYPLVALNAGFGAVQLASIAAQIPPKPTFREGGAVIKGKAHSQGGEDIYVGGNFVGNMQGDEGLFVTKKEATQALLNDYNAAYGGRAFHENESKVTGVTKEQIEEIIGAIPTPVVHVEDIKSGITSNEKATMVGVV